MTKSGKSIGKIHVYDIGKNYFTDFNTIQQKSEATFS